VFAKVCSASVNGIEASPVEVEVHAGWGDTAIVIVGLPDAAVKESRDRVGTALYNSGFNFPLGRTTINLAPADVKKEGPSFDLPIAIGMLAANEQIETDQLDNFVLVGELALTGAVRPVRNLSPHHSPSALHGFAPFQAARELPGHAQDPGRLPSAKADRPWTLAAATGGQTGTWSDRQCRRKMGERPEQADRDSPSAARRVHRIRPRISKTNRRLLRVRLLGFCQWGTAAGRFVSPPIEV
jgi:hypothetical protein